MSGVTSLAASGERALHTAHHEAKRATSATTVYTSYNDRVYNHYHTSIIYEKLMHAAPN